MPYSVSCACCGDKPFVYSIKILSENKRFCISVPENCNSSRYMKKATEFSDLCSPFMQECLMRLLSSKTVIYVTHQLEFLNAADLVLVNFIFPEISEIR